MGISSLMPCDEPLIAVSIAFSGQVPSVKRKIGHSTSVNSQARSSSGKSTYLIDFIFNISSQHT